MTVKWHGKNDHLVTAEVLRELLDYDPQTGIFRWRTSRGRTAKTGSVAGYLNKVTGYRGIYLCGKTHKAHRLAWLYVYGSWPTMEVDHADHNSDNNAIGNLREATASQNLHNRKPRPDGKPRGVYLNHGAWVAEIQCNGRSYYLGMFNARIDAMHAYALKSRELYGDFSPVDETENRQEPKRLLKTNKNGHKHVVRRGNRFRGRIRFCCKTYHVGTFDTPEQASAASAAKLDDLKRTAP